MKKRLPTIIVLVVLSLIGGAVVWLAVFREQSAASGPPETPVAAVETRAVTFGTLRDIRSLTGTLESSARFVVTTKVDGLVQAVLVDLGDDIEQGQVVARIDDAELRQALLQAEADLSVRQAELARAQSDLELAQREFDRSEQLRERGIAAEAQLDEIAARLRSSTAALSLAQAQVSRAESALELRRIELGYAQVRATWSDGPASGRIAERYQEPGNTVQANAPVVSVVTLDPLKAVVFVTERDYTGLRVGQAATITTDSAPGESFEATIERISPVFLETSRQARVELRVPNPGGRLRPGMFARVRIVIRDDRPPTVVPLAAVVRRDGRDVVFALDPGEDTVRMVPVTVTITDGAMAGLAESDFGSRVVTLGQQLLDDGTTIRDATEAGEDAGGDAIAERPAESADGPTTGSVQSGPGATP